MDATVIQCKSIEWIQYCRRRGGSEKYAMLCPQSSLEGKLRTAEECVGHGWNTVSRFYSDASSETIKNIANFKGFVAREKSVERYKQFRTACSGGMLARRHRTNTNSDCRFKKGGKLYGTAFVDPNWCLLIDRFKM